MKKKVLFLVAIMALFTSVASAQWKFGGGLAFGTKMGIDDDGDEKIGLGLNARADYTINETWGASGGLTYFFPSAPEGLDMNAWKLNADGHYFFLNEDSKQIYALAGLVYDYCKCEFEVMGYSVSEDDSEVGLQLGAGVNVDMFFGELRYDTSFEQFEITIGVLFGSK